MKTLVQDYIFDKVNKRVIFTEVIPSSLEEILLITNVSTGDIIYNFADKLRGGTLQDNVLTLNFDTATMNNSDSLQIFIESDNYHKTLMTVLTTLLKQGTYSRDVADRMRIVMENSPMMYVYNRNSGTQLNSSTEAWYSPSSWSTVDAREQLMEQNKSVVMSRMQRWTRT